MPRLPQLTKAHLDTLVAELVAGGTKTAKGRTRRPWSAVSVNKTIDAWAMVWPTRSGKAWWPVTSPNTSTGSPGA